MTNQRCQNIRIGDFDYQVIDISGLSKSALLAAFYNYTSPGFFGSFRMADGPMLEEDGDEMIAEKTRIMLGPRDYKTPGLRHDWHRTLRPLKDRDGVVIQENFEHLLHFWDYVNGRPLQLFLAQSVIVPYDQEDPAGKA